MASNSAQIADGSPAAATGEAGPAARLGLVQRLFFLLGLASLAFVFGAAVMFFDLPSSTFLRRGFSGGMAWYDAKPASPAPIVIAIIVVAVALSLKLGQGHTRQRRDQQHLLYTLHSVLFCGFGC